MVKTFSHIKSPVTKSKYDLIITVKRNEYFMKKKKEDFTLKLLCSTSAER